MVTILIVEPIPPEGNELLVDLNNDGFDDVLFWNFNDRRNFSSVSEEGFILLSNGTNEISNWNKISLPPGPFGINQTKYNHAAKGDLNNDGYLDLYLLNQPPNPGSYSKFFGADLTLPEYSLQLFKNTGNNM